MRKRALKAVNRRLFRLSVCVLVLGFLLDFASMWIPVDSAQRLIAPLGSQPIEIPFTFGALILFINTYRFYRHVLYRTEETAGDGYFSLVVMVLMLFISILILMEGISPYKFLVISVMLLAVAIQNYHRMRQCEGTPFGVRFAGWFWEALVYFVFLVVVGVIYARVCCPSLLVSTWKFLAVMIIQIGFLFDAFRVFLKRSRYFRGYDYKKDLSLFYGAD